MLDMQRLDCKLIYVEESKGDGVFIAILFFTRFFWGMIHNFYFDCLLICLLGVQAGQVITATC